MDILKILSCVATFLCSNHLHQISVCSLLQALKWGYSVCITVPSSLSVKTCCFVFFLRRLQESTSLFLLSLSDLVQFENYSILSSITILTTSILMVSKIPTYSLKRILIPRHLAIFLLLGIGIYVSLLIFYTFETLFFSGLIYIFLIPISYFHYKHKNKTSLIVTHEEETEDVL